MMNEEGAKDLNQDLGRADYVPEGEKKKYSRRFEDGAAVWMKVSATKNTQQLPDIVVYVQDARYEEREGEEYWAYKVQEKDKDGAWYGVQRWKKEKALKRA